MKILQVVHNFPTCRYGGVENLTRDLSLELSKRHEISIFYAAHDIGGRGRSARSFIHQGLTVRELVIGEDRARLAARLLSFDLPSLTWRDRFVEEQFEAFLDAIKPDVVHFQHLIDLSLALPMIAKKRVPVVLTLNDFWLGCPTTHFLGWDGRICQESSADACVRCLGCGAMRSALRNLGLSASVCRKYAGLIGASYGALGRYRMAQRAPAVMAAVGVADRITAISKAIIGRLSDKGLVDPAKVRLLSPGVDVVAFGQTARGPHEKLRFGFVGVASRRKGVKVLVEAFNMLGKAKAELLIFGNKDRNDSEFMDELQVLAQKNSSIKMIGSFSDPRVPYSSIDVLVVPSITCEGFGLTVQEAFCCGIPVIASDIEALNESVVDGKNGLLFRCGDASDLATKMRACLEQPELLRMLADARVKVKSMAEYASEFEAVYTEVKSER